MTPSWRPRALRRGVLPSPGPSLQAVATGPIIARVWLAVLVVGVAGWLVTGGPGLLPTPWTEGLIAPRYVYAPRGFSHVVEGRAVAWQRGELLVAKGQRVSAEQAAALRALAEQSGQPSQRWGTAGLWGVTALLIVVGGVLLRFAAPAAAAQLAHLALIGLLGLVTVGIASLLVHYTTIPVWATPMAGASMLVTLLLTPAAAVVMTVIASLLVGLVAHQALGAALAAAVGGAAGVVAVRGARRRGHLLRASAWSGSAQGVTILALSLVELQGVRDAAWSGAWWGIVSGAASFVVVIALLPVLENLFGLITNVTLLELSDLNHPLLKELSLHAPGTYHHSLIVATLAEAGCDAIGANGLLARVGCYFHDIGKLPKAEYFVENQPPGQSRHDALAPSMSSLIILNHVKEGIELAKRHRLNQAIIDFIPGHHGTGLIYFFYRRALEQVEDERLLKEEQFRYPGPRPHSRETAVAMLADSVEAACRALPARTPAKLLGVVRRIINNKFIDGQLDECDLTLRDLERIAAAFVRVLAGMYHSRVPYPVPPGEDVEEGELDVGLDPELSGPPRPVPPPPAAGAAGVARA
ncbi:MAG: HDIG domain-containing protein [Candidatus Omnitrophica bacterium]|nr:HDIG domain-containing protein [Candidatus Omnitrophota bacterium]